MPAMLRGSPGANPSREGRDLPAGPGYDHVMSPARTVLDHLLAGRAALVLEVERLSSAITELDAVIDRVGGSAPLDGIPAPAPTTSTGASEPVLAASPATNGRAAGRPRTTPARGGGQRSGRSGARAGAQPAKSIRVHVLEMLAAEDRDFGLAEIIDRIHRAGIKAHDDAVRSITIKLMKDGKVERVGRGHYRLADHDSGAAATPRSTEPDPAPDAIDDGSADDLSPDDQAAADPGPAYPPPLNLSQPWDPTPS
jgi:hypothetical protein